MSTNLVILRGRVGQEPVIKSTQDINKNKQLIQEK